MKSVMEVIFVIIWSLICFVGAIACYFMYWDSMIIPILLLYALPFLLIEKYGISIDI